MTNPDSVKIGGAQIKALVQDSSASVLSAPATPAVVAQKDLPLTFNRGLVPFVNSTAYDISYCYISMNATGSLAATAFTNVVNHTGGTGSGLMVTISDVPAGVPFIGVAVNGFVTMIYPTDPKIWTATTGTFEQKIPVFSTPTQAHNAVSELVPDSTIVPCKLIDFGLLEDGIEMTTMLNANTLEISGLGRIGYLGIPHIQFTASFAAPKPELEAFMSGASYFAGDADLPALLPIGKLSSACSPGAIFKVYLASTECGKTDLLTFYGDANTITDVKQSFKNNEATRISFEFAQRAHPFFRGVHPALTVVA